jgi:hypothetical protein
MRSLRPFVRWMGDRGIVWADGIHFRCDSEANLGVFTARDMEEGEPIVRIPKASCLTADNTGAAKEVGSCHATPGCSPCAAGLPPCQLSIRNGALVLAQRCAWRDGHHQDPAPCCRSLCDPCVSLPKLLCGASLNCLYSPALGGWRGTRKKSK